MQAASEQACRSRFHSSIAAEVSILIHRKAQGESQNQVSSLVQICILGDSGVNTPQYLFPFPWGISTNVSLNLNLSLWRSSIVTLHHSKQLVSPGLQFANEGRITPFLTGTRAFLCFSCVCKRRDRETGQRERVSSSWYKGQQYLTPHKAQRFTQACVALQMLCMKPRKGDCSHLHWLQAAYPKKHHVCENTCHTEKLLPVPLLCSSLVTSASAVHSFKRVMRERTLSQS